MAIRPDTKRVLLPAERYEATGALFTITTQLRARSQVLPIKVMLQDCTKLQEAIARQEWDNAAVNFSMLTTSYDLYEIRPMDSERFALLTLRKIIHSH